MDKKLFDICLRQGESNKQIIFSMGLDKETIDMMLKIHKEDPSKWDHNDIDLLHAAVDRLEKLKQE